MNTLEILQAGRKLISNPERWTQGCFARTATGDITIAEGPYAFCWCSMGALRKICENEYPYKTKPALLALTKALESLPGNYSSVVFYNDGNTHAQVLKLWDIAIENESLKGEN